jgi:hypothetical protein
MAMLQNSGAKVQIYFTALAVPIQRIHPAGYQKCYCGKGPEAALGGARSAHGGDEGHQRKRPGTCAADVKSSIWRYGRTPLAPAVDIPPSPVVSPTPPIRQRCSDLPGAHTLWCPIDAATTDPQHERGTEVAIFRRFYLAGAGNCKRPLLILSTTPA